ncbi:MAG: DPP IV N-terminal domain-containing protein, partial [Ginsengibacter sp.]
MADNESGKRIFQIEDIYDQETVSNPVLSPDGVWCAYVLSIPEKNDRGASDQIVLYQLRSKEKRVLIEGASPQWSPDGKFLAFESLVSDVVGIYIYDIQKDSATLLVNKYDSDFFIDHYAEKNFCWSPDGKSIFYVSTDATEIENKNVITREFNHLLYKTKGGRGREKYADSRISHLWSVNIESRSTLQITKGSFNEHSISASSSGSFLYFISNRSKNPDQNQWGRLFAIKIESREERALSPERESAFQPKCSPDGKYIAYLGIKSEVSTNDSPAEDTQIYIVSSLGGEVVCLTDKLDRRVEQFQWDSSSSSIFFTAGDAGSVFLYSVSIIDREITTIIKKQGKVLQFDISQDGKYLAFTHMDST